MKKSRDEYRVRIKKYNGAVSIAEEFWELDEVKEQERQFESIPCKVMASRDVEGESECFRIQTEALQKLDAPISLSLERVESQWDKREYVFMPAAVYNGNRQESKKLPYPPYYVQKQGDEWIPVITDIPHLDIEKAQSSIQLLSGDMSTPSMGYFRADKKDGILLLSEHKSKGRYQGFTVQESAEGAVFRVTSPGVREENVYYFGELPDGSGFYPASGLPSDDEGVVLDKEEILELKVMVQHVLAENLYEYFSIFNKIREELETGVEYSSIPFSTAYDAIREKYIKMNFNEEGYFRVGTENTVPPSFWQAGWVGGGMSTLPFLLEASGTAYEEALSTLEFISSHLQTENGWYIPMYCNGKCYGDDFRNGDEPILLVRKDADLLYFMLKQAFYLKQHQSLPESMESSIEKQADAFVRFVQKNGQLGQFIHMGNESLEEGGTASAAIAPAALALAYEYFGKQEYLETAVQLGNLYWEDYLKKGLLNGGPGEICQAPDSESAFGCLESCVQLYETTGDKKWLQAAREAFELAITWVVSYDFDFPEGSAASKIHAHSQGTVFANAQNKHSAPGICTLSGNSMLKLYRFTGEERYLEWMKRISHALSQFVSLKDRQIDTLSEKPLPSGYMNERVQMSDWEGKHTVGEFLYGSNWPEVSMLLTYVEIPGIYIDLDRDVIKCIDHVEAEVVKRKGNTLELKIKNTTSYSATVTVMADHSKDRMIGKSYFEEMKKVTVEAGAEKVICL